MTSGPCPDENALVRFSGGKLSGADLGAVEQHLDGCSACRTLIAQLASLHSKTLETPDSGREALVPTLQGRVGRYHVERLVGGGGMGMVYAGRDRELNRVVAIKVLKTGGNAEARARLLREAQTMAKLSHPNLVPIFELGTDQGDDFLAMELIDGPTLDFWLRERKRSWQEIVGVFLEAGRGLEAAHQAGVVHRDFKPANVLIGPDGRARVTDFGLARPRVPEAGLEAADGASIELTREGSLLGTPAYMSPEQLEGQVADVRSDQFSFCVALVEALVGHRPFAGRTPGELRAGMRAGKGPQFELSPARLKKALLKGMALSPDARYPSMSALLAELQAILRPSGARTGSIAAALAVVFLLVAGVVYQQRTAAPAPAPAPSASRDRSVSLSVGETQTLALPTVQRVQSADATIVDVQIVGNQQVQLTGRAPGRAEVVLLTRASPHDAQQPVTWTVEVADDGGRNFGLQIGESRALAVMGLVRIENEKVEIANAKITGKDLVTVDGLTPGVTVLKTFVAGREAPLAWRVEVSDRARTPLQLKVGEWTDLVIPDLARIAVGEAEVAEVAALGNSKVRVTAKRAGKTTLIAWTRAQPPRDDTRKEWEILVEAGDGTIHLRPGTQKVLSVSGLQRVAVGDASICDVKTIGNSQLLLIGGAPGRTTLLAWKLDGTRDAFTVVVGDGQQASPPSRPLPAVPIGETTELSVGEQRVFRVPKLQRIAVGDAAIADVKTIGDDGLMVTGQGVGKTTMLLWKSDGSRVSTVVSVTSRPTAREADELYTLVEGESEELTIPGMDRVEAAPEGVVDAHQVGQDRLVIAGANAGKAKLVVTQKNGGRRAIEVHVQAGEVEREELGLRTGEHKVLDLSSLQRFTVGDSAVLEAKAMGKQLMVFGKGKGKTTLTVWSGQGVRREWDVSVSAR